ncbi:hypothetical protein [Wenzhouxiangella marina]|uniref:Uncharacterized protein n=2 Tax=Wenzhouxiangella marina TaxID=1579979 RepID=A0A0K0XU65_9GAMM|nr:hypothetical protein [Wenzhouxiangella marina]AKS41244.1 hypothetical protein WM2015_863 [Wenzhouxiangella marina]MBB6088124.1 hypothetical protein [Wenzhouxiangella marina]
MLCLAQAGLASITVGSGGSISLGSGALDLGGGDLVVDGQFNLEAATVTEAGNVVINGSFDGGGGSMLLRGDWINNGLFNAQTSQISMIEASGGSNALVGDSIFYGLSLTSPVGGAFVLQSGSVQQIVNSLTILGASGQPVQIESSNPPQIAEMVLQAGGSQNIAFVGVSNVHATGEPLAPDETNQGGSGNDFGWFGSGLFELIPVPTLTIPGLLLMMLSMLVLARVGRSQAL